MKFLILLLGLTSICSGEVDVPLLSNHFHFKLYNQLKSHHDNIFYSPFSIFTSLGMVYGGSKGTTSKMFDSTLGFKGDSQEDTHQAFQTYLNNVGSGNDAYTLDIANVALVRKDFEVTDFYRDLLRSYYNAFIREIDTSSTGNIVEEVNEWVREKTHDKIKSLVDDISPNTEMILLNAVYFKGTWKTLFEKSNTKLSAFYNYGTLTSRVPLMHVKSKFPHYYGDGYQAIKLPYKGNDISMVVVLPTEREGLEQIEAKINSDEYLRMLSRLYETKVYLYLPKFKTEFSDSLSEKLKYLGLGEIFSPEANLSGIVERGSLYVSEILHKAVVEVNEEGSEAAAVTGTIINRMRPSLGDEPTVFKADHPFLFYIVDNRNDLILFTGRINAL